MRFRQIAEASALSAPWRVFRVYRYSRIHPPMRPSRPPA